MTGNDTLRGRLIFELGLSDTDIVGYSTNDLVRRYCIEKGQPESLSLNDMVLMHLTSEFGNNNSINDLIAEWWASPWEPPPTP